jgi:epoxyqueuosine reductase QueG
MSIIFDPAKTLLDLYNADGEKYFDVHAGVPLFDPPVVGVADADDPWFDRFKDLIGQFYWTPQEALSLGAPAAVARSVVCWYLPVAEVARRANRSQTEMPSREWAYVRTFGEQFLTRLRHGLEARLRDLGFAAVAPAVAPENVMDRQPAVGLTSHWSERHAAFVAGLGTFGISGGLITLKGKALRVASVVTDARIRSTPRPYGDDPFAWCLKTARGTCGECVARCPVASIGETVDERDKEACFEHGRWIRQRGIEIFGWEGSFGCGLCQTAVPCEDRNPLGEG